MDAAPMIEPAAPHTPRGIALHPIRPIMPRGHKTLNLVTNPTPCIDVPSLMLYRCASHLSQHSKETRSFLRDVGSPASLGTRRLRTARAKLSRTRVYSDASKPLLPSPPAVTCVSKASSTAPTTTMETAEWLKMGRSSHRFRQVLPAGATSQA